ncbi:MAG: alpha/beta family hydrolase [Actinomycetes bacterium]
MARRRRPAEVHGVVLFPGAGSASDHPSLLALEAALAPLPVFRRDFPYRRAGRRAPDRAPVLVAAVRAAVAEVCDQLGTSPDHLVIGGRSMGGRICTMAVAGRPDDDPLPAAGVVLLGYPLHPPGRPDRLRTEHLPDVDVPALFVSGDRDPFGTPDELSAALELVGGPVTSVTVPGARHELAGCDELVATAVRKGLGMPVIR